jgi:hypothetical protein
VIGADSQAVYEGAADRWQPAVMMCDMVRAFWTPVRRVSTLGFFQSKFRSGL